MSKHLFRLLFGAFFLVAATAFTGCSDDDDKSLTPKLTADPTALDFTDETATTQTVAITANCEWTVTASNLDWATISPMSGKGNGTISVTVSELPAGTNLREGKISFTLIHPEFGKWGQAESSVAVKQYGITPPVTETKTIAEVIAGSVGATYTTQGQVVAINGRSFLIQDNSGKILVYLGWKDNKPVVDYSATIGQTVKVTGKTTTYSKLVQFSETDLVIEKVSDGSFTQPTPEKFDGAAFDAYAAATPVIKYIEYSGTLTIDGYYYNIAVDGTDLQGSLAYPADGFVDASLNGQVVIVKGYTLGMTNQSKMLSTIAVSVEKDGDAPAEPKITKLDPTSLSFAATDNAKTVTVTAANADDCTIEAATDKSEQFTTSVKGMVVTVTPKENTTEQAITATLTIKLMKAGAAVDTKTVAISQAGKSVPGGSGYTRVNAIAAGKKYLVVAEVNSKYVVMPAAAAMTSSKFTGVDITVSGGKIESNEANDAYAVTIEANGDAYVIKNSAGKYIEHNSGTNFKLADTSSKTWTITYDNDKNWFAIMDVATSTEKTKRQLLYQIEDGSTSNRFGPYASSNADGVKYSGVALYELSE